MYDNFELNDLMEQVGENIESACYEAIEENEDIPEKEKSSFFRSSTSSEAQTIVFNNLVSGDALMEYFNYNVSGAEISVDNNEMYKTRFHFSNNDSCYEYNPMWMLYEFDEDNAEECYCEGECMCPEPEILKETSTKKVESDYIFSEDAKVLARDIVKQLDKSPFYHEAFHWKGIDNLLSKKEEFVIECEHPEIGVAVYKELYDIDISSGAEDLNVPNFDTASKVSGLKYMTTDTSLLSENQKAILIGYKTPMGLASYVKFEEFDREDDFGKHFALTSTGTADCLREKGLSSKVIQKSIDTLKERGEIFIRTSPCGSTPKEYTEHLDDLFRKANKEGKSFFMKDNLSEASFSKIKDMSKKDMIGLLKVIQEKVHNPKYLQYSDMLEKEKTSYLKRSQKANNCFRM